MSGMHPAVDAFVRKARTIGGVTDIWLAGSLASGDHRPGVSDIDLVVITATQLDAEDQAALQRMHRNLDSTTGYGAKLGCAYVAADLIGDLDAEHPTWTHGLMVHRRLSAMVRAELKTYGIALEGRAPTEVLPSIAPGEVRAAAKAELDGYWTWAAARPWLFLRPDLADLALVSMSRIRHAVATDALISKSASLDAIRAPRAVVEGVRRRHSKPGRRAGLAPRVGHHARYDTRRTITEHRL